MEILTKVYNDLLARNVQMFAGDYNIGSADACTVKLSGNFGLFLNIGKIHSLRQEKEAVVHEWAHIVSDATYGVDAPEAVRHKAEETARREELKELLPFDEMRGVVQSGVTQIFELSEYFNVSEEKVSEAIEYYTGPCGLTFA